jgi:putative transposase
LILTWLAAKMSGNAASAHKIAIDDVQRGEGAYLQGQPQSAGPATVGPGHHVHHVTSRGDRREATYHDDVERECQLAILAQAPERFDTWLPSYCLMGNRFRVVLQTRRANLSRFMRHLNGVYTQAFNRRHGVAGHLFQGRFKAILVDCDSYLLALCRYVERNPVAAKLVKRVEKWKWSSCLAHLGLVNSPVWLDSDALYGHLLGRTPS